MIKLACEGAQHADSPHYVLVVEGVRSHMVHSGPVCCSPALSLTVLVLPGRSIVPAYR